MAKRIDFSANTDLGEKLSEWWRGLENDRGQRAELRRAKSVKEVIMLPCFHRACRQFASTVRQGKQMAITFGLDYGGAVACEADWMSGRSSKANGTWR